MTRGKSNSSAGALSELSNQLAAAVDTASSSVVAIHARRRIPSSGILWRDGIIVSASHTVKKDTDITVTLLDGSDASAKVIGRDATTDVVALRLQGKTSGKPATLASDDASRVGSLVLAVGRPGRDVSASFGIVSAIGEGWRSWQGGRLERVLRLDLAIYDGFSGGALVDASGAVVGLNTSAFGRGTAAALPASVVNRVLDELLTLGHVRRPFLGVAVQPVTVSAALVQKHALAHDSALLVVSVGEGSPAERAGLYVGDALIEANGQPLRRPTDLLDQLASSKANESLTFKLLRGGNVSTVSVSPADRGPVA